MPGRSWDTSVWVGDPTITEQTLGWRACTPLAAGLAHLGEWMQQSPQRRERYRSPAA
jgi:hypothetical protein